jgi:hypothetical protein
MAQVGEEVKLRAFALVALIAGFALSGCQAAITYAPGQSARSLPTSRNNIIFEGISESNMTGSTGLPTSSADQAGYNDTVRDVILSKLQSAGISIFDKRVGCSDCVTVNGLVYVLPWNPLIGGHVNIFIKAHTIDGAEVFTAFAGSDFTLIDLGIKGSTQEIVRSMAGKAADRFVEEFRNKAGS